MNSDLVRAITFCSAIVCCGCHDHSAAITSNDTSPPAEREAERLAMVERQIERRGVDDPRVLEAMRKVHRHRFVPPEVANLAYADHPLPIGNDQTISQPFIVAFMVDALELKPGDRVLEVGTGSGYHAAVMAEIAKEVYSIEIVPQLAVFAQKNLREESYENVHVREGDGYEGWPEFAPFDAIVVTAAPDHVPQPLLDQLAVGGRMIIPVGDVYQELRLIRRTPRGIIEESTIPVRFVPMTGKARE